MYTEILSDIEGIAIFPIISLVVFVAIFAAMLIWTAGLDGRLLTRLSQLPLDDGTPAHAARPDRSREGARREAHS